MLTVAELHALIDRGISALPSRSEPLAEARGHVLAESLRATADQPSFDRSAMDGFAVGVAAEAGRFRIMEETLPGQPATATPGEGEALRVFTGSALPPEVKVVMQEHASETDGYITVPSMAQAGHVRKRGSATKSGDNLLEKGIILSPAGLSILAGEGVTNPRVIPAPRVAHITTGSEIVSPDVLPLPGQIRNTNATLMRALVEEAGAIYAAQHHVDESLGAALGVCRSQDIAGADVLLVSGGSSVGRHDRTAPLLEALGFQLICQKVNCRPGKPFLLGVKGGRAAIGLPGNPVSHFVAFHLFVRRILLLMAGRPHPQLLRAKLQPPAKLELNDRETYWPGHWIISPEGHHISPRQWLDSGHLSALAGINALIRLPSQESLPEAGDMVEFVPCGNLATSIP